MSLMENKCMLMCNSKVMKDECIRHGCKYQNKPDTNELTTKDFNDYDVVNKPKHYNKGGIECIEAIKVAVNDLAGIEAVCTGNVLKYIWRWKEKNGVEDLKKAKWYLERLISEVEQ